MQKHIKECINFCEGMGIVAFVMSLNNTVEKIFSLDEWLIALIALVIAVLCWFIKCVFILLIKEETIK